MNIKIYPSFIRAGMRAPASKSASQRALALSLLHKGTVTLKNPGSSDDENAALQVIREMGAKIIRPDDTGIIIESVFGKKDFSKIDCGESGLGVRMFTPIAALSHSKIEITGRGSLLSRPMNFFDEILPELGVSVESTDGRLPVVIQGPLQPKDITIDGSLSSQFLTGLLIAFAYASREPVNIRVNNLTSRPYIDLTLKMLADFGYQVNNHQYERFEIIPSLQGLPNQEPATTKREIQIESDWSSASFLLVAAAINGEIRLKGLDVDSTQADKEILTALSSAGVLLSVRADEIEVKRSFIKPFHFDARQCPDLFPPLVALAAYADGKSVIEGAGRLIHKESNRAISLQEEFKKMGIDILLQDDLMIIDGGKPVASEVLSSHHDHRIAMALTVAALGAEGHSMITGAEAVAKSYPGFFDDLQKCGAELSQV